MSTLLPGVPPGPANGIDEKPGEPMSEFQVVGAPHRFHRQEAAEREGHALHVQLLVVRRRRRLHRGLGLVDGVLQRFELRRGNGARTRRDLRLEVLDFLGLFLETLLEKVETIAARGSDRHVVVMLLRRVSRGCRVLGEGRSGQQRAGSRTQQECFHVHFFPRSRAMNGRIACDRSPSMLVSRRDRRKAGRCQFVKLLVTVM